MKKMYDENQVRELGSGLPSKTGNANKVLAVKANESGVEWIAAASGGTAIYRHTFDLSLDLAGSISNYKMDFTSADGTAIISKETFEQVWAKRTTNILGVLGPTGEVTSPGGFVYFAEDGTNKVMIQVVDTTSMSGSVCYWDPATATFGTYSPVQL